MSSATHDEYWLSVTDLSKAFGMSPQGFRASVLPHIPDDARRQGPRGLEIFGRAAIETWGDRRAQRKRLETACEVAGGDAMLAAGLSPALERYREARAGLAEVELAERRGVTVNVSKAHAIFTRAAHYFRSTGELLQRTFGPDAVAIFNDGLKEAIRVVDKLVEADAPDEAPP